MFSENVRGLPRRYPGHLDRMHQEALVLFRALGPADLQRRRRWEAREAREARVPGLCCSRSRQPSPRSQGLKGSFRSERALLGGNDSAKWNCQDRWIHGETVSLEHLIELLVKIRGTLKSFVNSPRIVGRRNGDEGRLVCEG